jgi:2,4-dienoyl-CoA reductase-like NADH-dependent reductase (Old Yellow Enzyme family)
VRISATGLDGGWDIEESVQLAKVLKEKGVDLIDVFWWRSITPTDCVRTHYRSFAERIKKEAGVLTAAVDN